MNAGTFHKRALVLPVLILLCCVPLSGKPSLFTSYEQWTYWMLFLGIPYAIVLLLQVNVLRGGSEAEVQSLAWRLPLWTALAELLLSCSVALLTGDFTACGPLVGIGLSIATIVLGYFYVLLVNVVRRFLMSVQWITESAQEVSNG